MAKEKTVYSCQQCTFQSRKWLGKCPDCGAWNSFVEERETKTVSTAALARGLGGAAKGEKIKSSRYTDVPSQDDTRISSGIPEFDRVLGGGIVPGSLVLIGGDPGIGKSTLLLQTAETMSRQGERVLYVSGEESERRSSCAANASDSNPRNSICCPKPASNGCSKSWPTCNRP